MFILRSVRRERKKRMYKEKAYMVFKGHGKEEREKSKFRSRPSESTYTMTTNRRTHFCDNMTERELEEEFRKLCNQLDKLRERCGPVTVIARRIAVMQEAATQYDRKPPTSEHSAPLKLNTVFSAVADRLMCTVTPAEESSSSGREVPFEAPPAYRHRHPTFTPVPADDSQADHSNTEITTDSPKRRAELNEEASENQNGVFKISGEANCGDVRPPDPMGGRNGSFRAPEGDDHTDPRPSSGDATKGVRSGHARTHAIVINLDDKSRFTEEVTV
ncbi:hypothetical protein EVAR_10588_1 [Eumeta japonica]|uniref:Uncharacterized protein n=1 Tax=Eumeta variegata TaxID=151549 RepID=A0A4C1U1U3_EUMVA|nr:hypothetical protein EVAR_10588_1 [Eumeta japonica]